MTTEPTYIIGIDLGTTNSVVAYTEANLEKGQVPDIRILEIPQLVSAGTVEKRPMLPSFILVPGKHDIPEGSLDLPWETGCRTALGEYARERGAEIPHRLISSSKSWLCHSLVDRNKPILPWDSPGGGATDTQLTKMSPVEAAAAILRHARDAWNHMMAADNEQLKMEYQDVLLTVPASFDAVARELTVKAAEMAGLRSITLLEEPQAAFYAWIEGSKDKWREDIHKGDMVLVCDVGGGTTDFSLISVTESNGDLVLERVAVGDHLLVGGDNMDLALAYAVSQELASGGKKLDTRQMRGLWHACRKAKEALLADPNLESYPITVLGTGRSLIGGTMKTKLTRETLEKVIVDGFFPKCGPNEMPKSVRKVGIREAGLSYESDPAITRHLASFLSRHGSNGESVRPTAILFNGGVMKPGPIRQRLTDILSQWMGNEIRDVQAQDFDLAVARGAAYYGLARRGNGIRIRGGLGKSYYIGVAAALPAVPGMPTPLKALCVAPFGMEEGTDVVLEDEEFVLMVGEPASFDFLGSSVRLDDTPGTIVEDWESEIEEITTLETTLDGDAGTVVPVYLEVRATEIGTLELWCVSRSDGRKWKLEFNVREQESVDTNG